MYNNICKNDVRWANRRKDLIIMSKKEKMIIDWSGLCVGVVNDCHNCKYNQLCSRIEELICDNQLDEAQKQIDSLREAVDG